MAIHDVHMYDRAASCGGIANLIRQMGEIRC
jgi:hypothetical protein